MINIRCTYCWTMHNVRSLESWMADNVNGCGNDPDRYFFTHDDYIAYVRTYEANGCQHPSKVEQLSLFQDDVAALTAAAAEGGTTAS